MLALYQDFVLTRQSAALARRGGTFTPSADDDTNRVIASYRFTNVFRVADWGSQFVVKELVGGGRPPHDVLASLILYRLTNTTPPWEFYGVLQGRPPSHQDMVDGTVARVFREDWGRAVFGTAYATHVGTQAKGANRLDFFVDLAAQATPAFAQEFHAGTPAERFRLLTTIPRIGDFLAMQILTDYGYGGNDCEDTFIVPGPGALRGAQLISPDTPAKELIYELRDMWRDHPAPPQLPNGLPPSLMDVQNTLCEFQKFSRYYKGGRGTSYRVKHPDLPALVLPENWRTLR